MIVHNQDPGSSGLSFSNIKYDLDTAPGSVVLGGSATVKGNPVLAFGTFELANLALFFKADGSIVNGFTSDCLAQFAWYDGTEFNVITN